MAKNPLLTMNKPVSRQKFSEVTRSAGIADNFAVRKVMNTVEGTIEKVPVNSNDIVNKAYADSIGGGGSAGGAFASDTYLGSDCSGLDGEVNRTLDVIHAEPLIVFVNNSFYHLNTDYTIVGTTVTFLNTVWDDQNIVVYYPITPTKSEYTGADCTGAEGVNRTLDVSVTPTMIFVNNSFYHLNTDYTIVGTVVTFLGNVWDDSPISVVS